MTFGSPFMHAVVRDWRPRRAPLRLVALVALAAHAGPAAAAECDCSRRVGLCQASADFDGETIAFTTYTDQCSRVSFTIAGHAAAITLRKGAGSARFAAPGASVSIDGCYVCDTADAR